MITKRNAVLQRIRSLEESIARANEYLESGSNADWVGFRPLFVRKVREGKELPPHKDWVRNVYLPRVEKAVSRAERLLEQLNQ
jgi:hypothetical protein